MNVLRAIGAFFTRIWRWIKDTAWVQPLLIVGVIFAIIFSIPAIVDGVNNITANIASTEAYYGKYQLSLEGGKDSAADKATVNIVEKMEDESVASLYGEKFFLVYVAKNCSVCAEIKGAFSVLESRFASDLQPKDKLPFKLVTIFADEVTKQTTTNETAFVQYMDRNAYFFEIAASAGYNTDYYTNGKISKTDLEYVESCDPVNFLTPTIMLIDYTETSPNRGVSEIMFGVSGDNDWNKAELLRDCWNHEGDFAQ